MRRALIAINNTDYVEDNQESLLHTVGGFEQQKTVLHVSDENLKDYHKEVCPVNATHAPNGMKKEILIMSAKVEQIVDHFLYRWLKVPDLRSPELT